MRYIFRTATKVVFSALFTVLILGGASAAAAQNPAYNGVQCNGAAAASPVCSAKATDPLTGNNGIIVKATNLIALIAGIAAVIIIIIAGISFITSSGDASKVSRARESIIYASVGLVVIVLARAIITFVVSKV